MTMVEKIARALCTDVDPDTLVIEGEPHRFEGGVYVASPHGSFPAWMRYRFKARAALECLKEPTNKMIAASFDVLTVEYGGTVRPEAVWPAFVATINAALTEGE